MVMSYFKFLDFDWSGLAFRVGCLAKGYHARLLVVSLGPFLLIAGIGLVPLGRKCTRYNGVLAHHFVQFDDTDTQGGQSHVIELHNVSPLALAQVAQSHQPPTGEARVTSQRPKTFSSEKEQATIFYLVLVIIFTFLPNVSRAIFSVWVCVRYASGPGDYVGFLRKDLSTQCGTAEHEALQALAYLLVLIWPVGMIALFVGVLVFNRKELSAGEALSTSSRAARFLTSGFRGKFFYWELVELTRCARMTSVLSHRGCRAQASASVHTFRPSSMRSNTRDAPLPSPLILPRRQATSRILLGHTHPL